jgi:hypothetical protein
MSRRSVKRRKAWSLTVHRNFAEADAQDQAYWRAQTPAARLRELERLRQLNYSYGPGKPFPRLQRVLKVAQLGAG